MFLAQTRTKPVNCPTSPILHKVSIPNSVISVSSVANPHISPIRLLPSYRCLLSMSYGSLLTTSTSQTALDAPSLVFLPPAGTCSLRPSLAATQRAAVAVQIVCPDDLSLNRSPCYAFGRRHPLAAQIRPERIWTLGECPKGALQGWSASKILRDHRINW